jgi:hypothetical protein
MVDILKENNFVSLLSFGNFKAGAMKLCRLEKF